MNGKGTRRQVGCGEPSGHRTVQTPGEEGREGRRRGWEKHSSERVAARLRKGPRERPVSIGVPGGTRQGRPGSCT